MSTQPRKADGNAALPPDFKAMAKEMESTMVQLGKDFKAAFEKAAEETKYELDKGLAKVMAEHPELYADIRRTMRQAKKTVEQAAKAIGLDDV